MWGDHATTMGGEPLHLIYGVAEESDLEDMVQLLGAVFSRHDPPAVATGLTPAEFEEFVRLLCPAVAIGGVTIVGRDDTGQLAGALLTEDSASSLPSGIDHLSKKFEPIFDILGQLDADYRQGKPAVPGEALHLFLLGVSDAFAGRGVAQQLVGVCVEYGKRKGNSVAVTEATNNVSQHIFRKLGFVDRVQRSYRDHRCQGGSFFADIHEHIGPVLMEKLLA
jgi:ribosomal protein S18 acetylase RimI-like enzyme